MKYIICGGGGGGEEGDCGRREGEGREKTMSNETKRKNFFQPRTKPQIGEKFSIFLTVRERLQFFCPIEQPKKIIIIIIKSKIINPRYLK